MVYLLMEEGECHISGYPLQWDFWDSSVEVEWVTDGPVCWTSYEYFF